MPWQRIKASQIASLSQGHPAQAPNFVSPLHRRISNMAETSFTSAGALVLGAASVSDIAISFPAVPS